jgi:hypothetical protein
LEEHGYLRRERARVDGKLGKCIYVITDSLNCEKPNVENPHVENPRVDNQAQLNTKELNTKELNTKRLYLTEFEKLWELYPKKQGRKNAEASYLRARKEGVPYEDVEQGINAYVEYIKATNTQSRYIKHGSTFFNQRAWQDDWTVDRGYSFSSGKTEESFEDMIARL